jgi:virginiamycin A acetyltransferase
MLVKFLRNIYYLTMKISDTLRFQRYKLNANVFDRKVKIGKGSRVLRSKFGRYSGCNINCIINDTEIGSFVNIAWNVHIGPRSHIYTNFTTHDFIYTKGEHIYSGGIDGNYINKIGHDAWIGCNVTILPSVEIGNGVVVAAGSIVIKSVPPYAIVGGNPAKFIKWRFTKEQIKKLEDTKWYEWDEKKIIEHKKELENIVDFNIGCFKENYFKRQEDMKLGKSDDK